MAPIRLGQRAWPLAAVVLSQRCSAVFAGPFIFPTAVTIKRYTWLFILLAGITFAPGCGPAGSSKEMKDLQARLDLVQCLGEIQRSERVTQPAIDGITAYAESITIDEDSRQQLLTLSDELFRNRKSAEKIIELTQAMMHLVPLPEKYAKAYGL